MIFFLKTICDRLSKRHMMMWIGEKNSLTIYINYNNQMYKGFGDL